MKTRRPILSQAQRDRIAELREEQGWSFKRIAENVGCSEGSVAWYCLRAGIDGPKFHRNIGNRNLPAVVMRNGYPVRAYTPQEDAQLLELERQGMSYNKISKTLGRKRNSIIGRLCTLARQQRAQEAAE